LGKYSFYVMNELEQHDLSTLLALYMEEAKAFTTALNRGDSWQSLQEKRRRIQLLNEQINIKYQQSYPQQERKRNNQSPDNSSS
jgi:hypothetical protein